MSIQSRFNFTGEVSLPKSTSKMPFIKEFSKGNQKLVRMNFGIKESGNNMVFVEAFGGVQRTIKTMNADKEKIEIDWNDRFDEEVVNTVANYRKFTVDLGEDFGGRQEFISQYDAILHLNEWLPKYKGKVCAIGQYVKEFYKDKYYDKFKVTNIYAVDDDVKSRLALTMDFYYNKDSIDKADLKAEKKIYLSGWVSQYINETEKSKFVPQQLVFNATKYDLNNERHKALYDYKMQYVDINKKDVVHLLWDVVLLRGAEEAEFTEDMLTKSQKEQIELGIKTLDDFKPRGVIIGDKINEFRLLEPKLVGDFEDGLVDADMKWSEFEEMIYVPNGKIEKLEDAIEKTESVAEEEPEIDEDDLF